MRGPTPIDVAPPQGARSDVERRADSGDVRRRGHAAKQSGEGASSQTAPVQRAAGELKASNAARAAYAPRTEGLDVSAQLAELRTLGALAVLPNTQSELPFGWASPTVAIASLI